MAEDSNHPQRPGLVHVLITAKDEASAYLVFDALVERFPGVNPPWPCPADPGLVVFSVFTPTVGPAAPRPPQPPPPGPSVRPPPADRSPTGG